MGRPRKIVEGQQMSVGFFMDRDEVLAVDRLAHSKGLSRADAFRRGIALWIEAEGPVPAAGTQHEAMTEH